MHLMLVLSTISVLLPSILLMVIMLMSARGNLDREKSSPFECGFDPNHSARVPFSTRFFLLAIIFIVFDIEIVLLIPIPMLLMLKSSTVVITSSIFLIILFLGLLHEWNQGSLNWVN